MNSIPATSTGAAGPAPAARSVLILGANGRFGAAAAQAFDAAGWRVFAQVRRAAAPGLPAAATLVQSPLANTAALRLAAAGASVVVHAVNPAYTRWDAEALPALRCGLDVAEALGAHFMLPGNVYNFGEGMPALLRADTPQRPTTRKGEIRVEMETQVRRRSEAAGLRATVLRAGDFFGAGTGSWFDLVIAKSLRSGKLVYPGPLAVVHAWAYLPDLTRAFVAVAGQPAAASAIGLRDLSFAGHALTGAQFLLALERAAASLGVVRPDGFARASLPWALMRAVGTVYPLWRELARMSYLWRVPHALDGTALDALPGLPPGTAIEVALRDSLLALGFGPAAAGTLAAVPR